MANDTPMANTRDGESPIELATRLTCWSGPVTPEPLRGGITNTNFVVRDDDDTFVVRIGHDLPLHGIVRHHELATCQAAHSAGLSPEIVHHEPGAMVMAFIDAATLTADDLHRPEILSRVADLVRRSHTEMPRRLRGATLMFWVFQVCRNYLDAAAATPCRLTTKLSDLGERNAWLEKAAGAILPAFCHNDLLAANFLDDGDRLWLLDWEYAGWNSASFDLANLASNNGLTPEQEMALIEGYFGRAADPDDLAKLQTMKCASLLRESLWSLVQERHSTLDFDYESYTDDHLRRFEGEWNRLEATP